MNAPAGWYPVPGGNLRYWDGARWTSCLAPDPNRAASADAATGSLASESTEPLPDSDVRVGVAGWFGWGGLCLVALSGAISSGVAGFLILSGSYLLVVALVALIRGRVGWARLRSRAAGGVACAVAMAFAFVGAATADQATTRAASPSTSQDPPSSPVRTAASPSPSPTPTPTPTPSATATPSATPTPTASPTRSAAVPSTAAEGTALAAIARLEVKGRAPKTGYSRDQFGQAWFDTDRNGCDTRNDILRRDLVDRAMKNGCKVLAGTRSPDPYTGKSIRFVIGGASEIDIDHVVPLSDAWQKGAATWAAGKRLAFANDPLNLLAVDAGANRSKGDGDAATWLPPNKAYRCEYVARIVSVKVKYQVRVTSAERDAMVRVLSTCASTALPAAGPAPTSAAVPRSTPRTTPAPVRPSAAKPKAPASVSYPNCAAVRAAGADPIHAGDPGYSFELDRDRDGVACE